MNPFETTCVTILMFARFRTRALLLLIALAPLAACKDERNEQPRAVVRDERARIEALLVAIAKSSDVIFIRNGSEHSASAAADHLRSKWGGANVTAEAFIDSYGTKSSTSGRPYRVRIAGTEKDAGPWMHELLAKTAPR